MTKHTARTSFLRTMLATIARCLTSKTAVTVLALTAIAGGTVATSAASAAPGDRFYEFSAREQRAMSQCVTAQREARDIPGTEIEYRAWWTAHQGGSAAADWSAAYETCRRQSYTTGTFDYDHLVLVRVER